LTSCHCDVILEKAQVTFFTTCFAAATLVLFIIKPHSIHLSLYIILCTVQLMQM